MPGLDFTVTFRKLILPILQFFGRLGLMVLMFALALFVYAWMKYQFPFRINAFTVRKLRKMSIRMKLLSFLRWLAVDTYFARKNVNEFRAYGLKLFCGRQGSGKTTSMVHYANLIRRRYPNCIIVSNFRYKYADMKMKSWRDFLEIRNGEDGVLFLIDEIHSEFSSSAWKDFPENLLAEISQQRKQRVQICATAQIFTRVVKQIREQTDVVVQCSTVGNRWTFNKEYDAKDYELFCESASREKRLRPLRRSSFVQGDTLRRCFDTYEKIERLAKMEFIPRHERGSS